MQQAKKLKKYWWVLLIALITVYGVFSSFMTPTETDNETMVASLSNRGLKKNGYAVRVDRIDEVRCNIENESGVSRARSRIFDCKATAYYTDGRKSDICFSRHEHRSIRRTALLHHNRDYVIITVNLCGFENPGITISEKYKLR